MRDWVQKMNDIVTTIIDTAISIAIGTGIDFAIDKKVADQKFKQMSEQIHKIVERESDTLNQERLHEFLFGKCEVLFWGKCDLNEEEIIQEIEAKYGIVLLNDTKRLLLEAMRLMHENINEILSPELRMLMVSNQQMKAQIYKLSQKIDMNIKLIMEKDCDFQQKDQNTISMVETNARGDWEKCQELWKKNWFNENDNARKLSDIFVKTNYSFIEINKKERNGSLGGAKNGIGGYVINKTSNKYDENLSSEYVLRHFKDLKRDSIHIDQFLNKQINSEKKLALIFGLPGAGKSSIVAYMAGDYFKSEKNSIFVLLSRITYEGNLLEAICKYLKVDAEMLENKFLILDGLDEIAKVNDAETMLVNFIDIVNRKYQKINIFITLRENYVDITNSNYIQYYSLCNIARIEYFGKIQMVDFHQKYTGKMIDYSHLELLVKEREVFGIPLLLYIVYSLNVDVTDNDDKYRVYEKIFSINGGIYDKCNEGKGGYSREVEFSVEEKKASCIL